MISPLKIHVIFLRQESFQSTASAAAWVSFIVVALLFAGGRFSWELMGFFHGTIPMFFFILKCMDLEVLLMGFYGITWDYMN